MDELIEIHLGDIVYLVTDPEQKPRIVTGFLIRVDGVKYELSSYQSSMWCYDFEFTKEQDQLTKILNNN